MLWEVDVLSADSANDHAARAVVKGAADLGIIACTSARAVTAWLIEGELSRSDLERVAASLLADPVTEQFTILELTGAASSAPDAADTPPAATLPFPLHVLPKPGVTDPAAQSVLEAMRLLGLEAVAVRSVKKYWLPELPRADAERLGVRSISDPAHVADQLKLATDLDFLSRAEWTAMRSA